MSAAPWSSQTEKVTLSTSDKFLVLETIPNDNKLVASTLVQSPWLGNIDADGKSLESFGFISSNGGTLPAGGAIRLPNAQLISWAATNPSILGITLNSSDEYEFDSSLLLNIDDAQASITINANHDTPAADLEIGDLTFLDDTDLIEKFKYSSIVAEIANYVSPNTEGSLKFYAAEDDSTFTNFLTINPSGIPVVQANQRAFRYDDGSPNGAAQSGGFQLPNSGGGAGAHLAWRNAAGDDDCYITVDNLDDFQFSLNGDIAFEIFAADDTVNHLELGGAASGSPILFRATSSGSETVIDMQFLPASDDLNYGAAYGNREAWNWSILSETATLSVNDRFLTQPAPYEMLINDVIGGLSIAATGTNVIIDIRKETAENSNSFATVLDDLITIEVNEYTSTTAATPPLLLIDEITWEKGTRLELILTQVDSNTVARGPKISLITKANAK